MTCKNCGPKLDVEFYITNGKQSGSYCKSCVSSRNKTLYKEVNKDRVKTWRLEHPEEYKAQVKRCKKNQKERMLKDEDYGKEVRLKKLILSRKNFTGTLVTRAKLRAAKLSIPFNLNKEDIIIPDVCPLLEVPLTFGTKEDYLFTPSLDRIEPSKGYVKSNVRVISMLANTMKSNATKDQLLTFTKNIGTYMEV